jgi:hypothetical protein
MRVHDALAEQVLGGIDLRDPAPLGQLTQDELLDIGGNTHATKVSTKSFGGFNLAALG